MCMLQEYSFPLPFKPFITPTTNTHTKRKRKINKKMMSEMKSISPLNQLNTEIVFFDIETTVPKKTGQKFHMLEFGSIIVCPTNLEEIETYTTLVRPKDLAVVPIRSNRPDGIIREAISHAPLFEEVADKIYKVLHGKVWAGHNIRRFDCVRIKEAFQEAGRDVPVPIGMIDSLGLLTHKFGRRAGDMKMASLATYFGLGQQKHRSLDDVRMNLEVVKHCATVLFLESSFPTLFVEKVQSNSRMTTRSRSHVMKLGCKEETSRTPGYQRALPYARTSLRRVTQGMKNFLYNTQANQPIHNLLKRSRLLL